MLREIYFGKVIPWERKNNKNEEHLGIVRKIEDEERYFISKMSLDDCERFQKLVNMYTELGPSEEGEIFSYGFTMGAMLKRSRALVGSNSGRGFFVRINIFIVWNNSAIPVTSTIRSRKFKEVKQRGVHIRIGKE